MQPKSPCHNCPGCGAHLRAIAGYPWYFCNGCLKRATDGDGRLLEFGTLGLSSIRWRYVGCGEEWHNHRSALCLIDKRPVYVTEARFGGVIAQPLFEGNAAHLKGPHLDDLRIKRGGGVPPEPSPQVARIIRISQI